MRLSTLSFFVSFSIYLYIKYPFVEYYIAIKDSPIIDSNSL